MSRILCMGVIVTIMSAISAVHADPPVYKPVPSQLFQTRNGLGNVFAKLKAGQEVRIAYFGGSITAAGGWRVKTLKWFQQQYPTAQVSEINAAIGGTGSDLGVFRFKQDVLDHKPDLIFVEFAVNDGGAEPNAIWRTMEGIVRQAWEADPTIDICYVYTFVTGFAGDLDKGMCPRAAGSDDMLAEYYGIPSINVAMRIAELHRQGKLIFVPEKDADGKDKPVPEGVIIFSHDGVHPLDAGHQIYCDVIADALQAMEPASRPGAHELKAPFVADNFERAKLVPIEPSMVSAGWKKLDPKEGIAHAFLHFMPEMWQATEPGERVSFKFKGTAVKLYDIIGPDGANVVVTLDGKAGNPIPMFDSYCSYHRLATLWIAEGLPDAEHTVSVEVQKEQPNRHSVTDIESKKANYDPKKYDGTVARFGSIMLMGEIVK